MTAQLSNVEMQTQNNNHEKSFSDLVGIYKIKEMAVRCLASCKIRKAPFPHTLLIGPGGTGKTTIARAIANELCAYFVETEAAELRKRDKINKALIDSSDKCQDNFIFFIDEIHRLPLNVQEALYIPMKEFVVNVGTQRICIKPWTLFGATTRPDMLDEKSFVSRFQNVWEVGIYRPHETLQIIFDEIKKQNMDYTFSAVYAINDRSLGIPRIAVNLVEKARDQVLYAHPEDRTIREEDVKEVFNLEEIDDIGLSKRHIKYLMSLFNANGKPRGLGYIVSYTGCQKRYVVDVIEPLLIQLGMVEITPRGRILTDKGYKHLMINHMV